MNNFNKYLPSRKFVSVVLFIVVLIVLFFFVKGIISFIKSRIEDKQASSKEPVKMTVGGIIQKDSNGNGIADWEEYLWGLNPNKNGEKNKEFILSKKKALSESGIISIDDDTKTITENEILSREFFATIMALQQSGELNEESIKSLSESIGQKIEVTPIPDIYKESELIIVSDNPKANETYISNFEKLANKYADADIGKELTLISQGLGSNDPQAMVAVRTIASSYRLFGEELITIPVPNSIATYHLSLANNYEKNAQSIESLSIMLSDPIIGMRAILNYKQYNDALISDMENIAKILH